MYYFLYVSNTLILFYDYVGGDPDIYWLILEFIVFHLGTVSDS